MKSCQTIVVSVLLVGAMWAPAAMAEEPYVRFKLIKLIDPYLDAVRWWPTLSAYVPGASSIHLNVFDKMPDTPMNDEGEGEWSWEPTPPPWTLALDDPIVPIEGLNDLYSGFWTVTVNKGHATDQSVYTFTLNSLANSDWASVPELLQPIKDEAMPENYYFRWWYREGVFMPPGTHGSLSIEHLSTGNEVEVNSDWGTLDLHAQAHRFVPGELTHGECMARVQYVRMEPHRIVGFTHESGPAIAWEDGTAQLELSAGQNLEFWVTPAHVNNGGFAPTEPPDPVNPFAGWTLFGPTASVTAVPNPYDLPADDVPLFTAWSPGGLTQVVDTPDDPFYVVFDYGWRGVNDGAFFTVYLDGQPVGSIACPDVPDADWQTCAFAVDASRCGLEDVELKLEIDGLTGTSLVVDDFEFSNVPEPAGLGLLGVGAVAALVRRRR